MATCNEILSNMQQLDAEVRGATGTVEDLYDEAYDLKLKVDSYATGSGILLFNNKDDLLFEAKNYLNQVELYQVYDADYEAKGRDLLSQATAGNCQAAIDYYNNTLVRAINYLGVRIQSTKTLLGRIIDTINSATEPEPPPVADEPAPVTPESDPALQDPVADPLAPVIDEPPPVTSEEIDPNFDPNDPLAPVIDEPPPVTDQEIDPNADPNGFDDVLDPEGLIDEPPIIDEDPAFLDGDLDTDEGLNEFLGSDEGDEGGGAGGARASGPSEAQAAASEGDWRVRLSLAASSEYLYKAAGLTGDIMSPLRATNGIVFPYLPTITVNYSANYNEETPAHANYKNLFYNNSNVGDVTITADFTAQDSAEASYMLAVIHFGRSITKMFYGQDEAPPNGVPPPLVFLTGVGDFHFSNHPLVVSGFQLTYPNNVDYIRCTPGENIGLADRSIAGTIEQRAFTRLNGAGNSITPGGLRPPPNFTVINQPNYIPTKMTITFTCKPIVSRNVISNDFSLRDYASGAIYSRPGRGGIW